MVRFAFSKSLWVATLLLVACERQLFAHPGHAVEVVSAESPLHYFMQPEHGFVLAACAAIVWLATRRVVFVSRTR